MAGSTDKIMLIMAFVSSFFIFVGLITSALFLSSEDKATLVDVRDFSLGKLLPEGLIGRYNSSSLKTSSWDDLSGKGNHIKTENITGVDKIKKGFGFKGEYVYGGIDTSVEFPQEFKGNNWTFFAVARYNGTNKERIFSTKKDSGIDWLAGFQGKKTGVAHYGDKGTAEARTGSGWLNKVYDETTAPDGVTYNSNVPNSLHGENSWVLLMSTKTNFRTNGKNRHDSNKSTYAVAPEKMGINLWDDELSDWAVYEILIFDKFLADDRIIEVETYLREKYILTDLSSGIDYKRGELPEMNFTKKTLDFFGTSEECRLHAREQGSKMWSRNTEEFNDNNNNDRNKCFFYDDHVPENDDDKFDGDDNNVSNVTGCVEKGKDVSTYCTTDKTGSYGPVADITGDCKVVEGSGGAYITDEKIQSDYCDKYINKPQCVEGTLSFDSISDKNKSEHCRWDDISSPSPSPSPSPS